MKLYLRKAIFVSCSLFLLIHLSIPHLESLLSGVWSEFNNKVITWEKCPYFYFETIWFWKSTKEVCIGSEGSIASTRVKPPEYFLRPKSRLDFYVWHLEVYNVTISGFSSSLTHKLHLLNAKLTSCILIRTSQETKGCRLSLLLSTVFIQMFVLSMTIGHFSFHKIWEMYIH